MYTIYVLWLLQAVLILLLAMVGAIVITIKPNSSISNSRSHSNYNTIGSASPYAEADNKYLHYIHSRSTGSEATGGSALAAGSRLNKTTKSITLESNG